MRLKARRGTNFSKSSNAIARRQKKQLESEIAKIEDIGTIKPEDIEAKKAELKGLQQEVENLKKEKIEEEDTLKSATAQRGKEHEALLKDEEEKKGIENTGESALKKLHSSQSDPDNATSFLSVAEKMSQGSSAFSRQLAAFLAGQENPSTGEAVAYIKNIEEEAETDFQKDVAEDAKGGDQYDGVKTSKERSVKTVLNTLTRKMKKIGDMRVEIVEMQHQMADGAEALAENKKLLAQLNQDCAKRATEQQEKVAIRAEEDKALQDTIKMLTSDDALDLFRNVIKKPSFLQIDTASGQEAREEAHRIVSSIKSDHPEMSFIALALAGKQPDFSKVFKKIDSMLTLLGKEGKDDATKKDYCDKEFDEAADKAKELKSKISELSASVEEKQAKIETLTKDISSIKDGLKSLDESIASASQNREGENAAYQELMSQDSAAVQLLGMAKDRLQQFYQKNLAKPPTTTTGPYDLSLVSVEEQAPQGQQANGVIGMITTLVNDLEKEMLVAKTEEQNDQKDYEGVVSDSKKKRESDLKDARTKEGIKAGLEGDSEEDTQEKDAKLKEQQAAAEYIADLHKECDWLLKNFDLRKEARTQEIEQLKTAKSVLAGADFS